MLISNPIASPLFVPTLATVIGILGGSLIALLVAARFRFERLRSSALFARWRVWAVIAPVYGLAVLAGPGTTVLLTLAITIQGLREYATLVGLPPGYRRLLIVFGLIPAPVALIAPEGFYLLPPILLAIATLQPLLLREPGPSVRHLAFAALGWGYLAWFLAHLSLIAREPGGAGSLLAIGLATALSDVGAFTAGKLFGRHPLAPRLSPSKTREGAVGNLIGAAIGIGLMAFALAESGRLLLVLVLPIVVAVGAVWGDLFESSLKREFGAKDTGTWLPGFGGLLDRIDSLVLVAPLVAYTLRLTAGIGG